MVTKMCTKCKAEKELQEFGPDSRTRDGRKSRCRICDRESAKVRRDNRPDYYRARNREYNRAYRSRKRGDKPIETNQNVESIGIAPEEIDNKQA